MLNQYQLFAQRIGNIGSELGRACHWDDKGRKDYRDQSLERTLGLIDDILTDERGPGRLREITRFRELVSDKMSNNRFYDCMLSDLQKYCMPFALLARKNI